jgi:hypothetical protein
LRLQKIGTAIGERHNTALKVSPVYKNLYQEGKVEIKNVP